MKYKKDDEQEIYEAFEYLDEDEHHKILDTLGFDKDEENSTFNNTRIAELVSNKISQLEPSGKTSKTKKRNFFIRSKGMLVASFIGLLILCSGLYADYSNRIQAHNYSSLTYDERITASEESLVYLGGTPEGNSTVLISFEEPITAIELLKLLTDKNVETISVYPAFEGQHQTYLGLEYRLQSKDLYTEIAKNQGLLDIPFIIRRPIPQDTISGSVEYGSNPDSMPSYDQNEYMQELLTGRSKFYGIKISGKNSDIIRLKEYSKIEYVEKINFGRRAADVLPLYKR